MNVTIKDCDEFYKILTFCEKFNTDVNVNCSEEGWYLQCMDSTHTAIVEFKMPISYFAHYECDKNYVIGLHLKVVLKVIKNTIKKKDTVLLLKYNEKNDYVEITIQNSKEKFLCTYNIRLIDISADLVEIPTVAPQYGYTVPCSILKKWKEHVYDIHKAPMKFTPAPTGILIESNLDEQNKVAAFEGLQPSAFPEDISSHKFNQTINEKNMERIMSLLPFGTEIKFNFVQNIPLLTYVTLSSGMELKGYYAPKMNDDEEEEEEEEEIVPERNNKKRKLLDEEQTGQVPVAAC